MTINELYKYRNAHVLKGETFQAVVSVLTQLGIDYKSKDSDDNNYTIINLDDFVN